MNAWWAVLRYLLETHRGRIIGAIGGLIVALLIISLGFLWTLFVAACVGVGYYIGRRYDEGSGETLSDVLDRVFPPEHQ
ncbi:MAG: DUF2273 domain-containing protein [Bacillota bacterium]